MHHLYRPLAIIILLTLRQLLIAQEGVGIGTTTPHESAVLDVTSESGTKGMLIPRIPDRGNIVNPTEGLIIYHEATDAFEYYDGLNWVQLIPTPSKFDLDMGGNGITNLADGVADGDAVNKLQAESIAQTAVETYGVLNDGNTGTATGIKMRIVEIGPWDMDATSSIDISLLFLLAGPQVRSLTGVIRSDQFGFPISAYTIYPIPFQITGGAEGDVTIEMSSFLSALTINRRDGGFFDSAEFSDTSFSRGYLTIIYEQ